MANRLSSGLAPPLQTALAEKDGVTAPELLDAGAAEHILLAGDDWELQPQAADIDRASRPLRARFVITNRLRRFRIELSLYEQGCLGIRQHRRGRPGEERMIDLRHVDSKPAISRFVPVKTRKTALWLMVCAGAAGALAYTPVWPSVTGPLAVVLGAGAAVSWLLFVWRLREQIVFRTRYGRVTVVKLAASLGCIRACRAVVPRLVAAIREARELAAEDRRSRLREEMRETYRLRDTGIISREVCTAATRRILARFD